MPVARTAQTYTVSEIAALLATTLRDSFPPLRVVGEISNFMRARSGHCYFVLKDDSAQINCVLFRTDAARLAFDPADGDAVEVAARLDFYPGNGKLQLKCSSMQRAGEGRLLAAFEALRQKLAAEGLFDEALKRPLPRMPQRIGIVTSSEAAALRDILTTLARRWPLAELFLMPVAVQGTGAAEKIAAALARLPRQAPVEVILLARGGGSIEDLWAFNEEVVARAIRACPVPVVCGVGHETDTTIADWAADLRAPTPTAAAEHVAPDQAVVRQRIDKQRQQLVAGLQRRMTDHAARLRQLRRLLAGRSPEHRIQQLLQQGDLLSQRLDRALMRCADQGLSRCRELRQRLQRGMQQALHHQQLRLSHQRRALTLRAPDYRLRHLRERCDSSAQRLTQATTRHLGRQQEQLRHRHAALAHSAPRQQLEHLQRSHHDLAHRLHRAFQRQWTAQDLAGRLRRQGTALSRYLRLQLASRQTRLHTVQARLEALGPRQTLRRGFAIVHNAHGGIVRAPEEVARGERLRLQLAAGTLGAVAEGREDDDAPARSE